MLWPSCTLSGAFLLLLAATTPAQNLAPSAITLQAKDLPLHDLLVEIKKQTGNAIIDARSGPKDSRLSWDLKNERFWPALDELCRRLGCRASVHHNPRAVSLLDGAPRPAPRAYDGPLRVLVDRASLVRDFEYDIHQCHVSTQVIWEPRFQPYYLEIGKASAVYATGKERMAVEVSEQGKQELTGSAGSVVTYRFTAPPRRGFDRIETLQGTLTVVGPTRMLAFTFDKLAPLGKDDAPRAATQEGVKVALKQLNAGPDRWSFTLEIDNAPGVPLFESYQSWLGNNEVLLKKDKETWAAEADNMEVLLETAQKAVVRYHFIDARRLRGAKLADWTLVTTTPHRIVETPVRFEIRDIALP